MDQLIVVSSDKCFKGESDKILELFEEDMNTFHLRKPGITMSAHDTLLMQIPVEFKDRVVLHQYREAGAIQGFNRFHLSETERKVTQGQPWEKYMTGNYRWSTSVHSLLMPEGFQYAFYGPVFNSISKKGYMGAISHDFTLPEKFKRQLVAIGGITLHSIKDAFAMGFTKVAVLGALWNNPANAVDIFRGLKDKCQ